MGWCSMVYPPSDRWPGVAARFRGWCSMICPPSGRCGPVACKVVGWCSMGYPPSDRCGPGGLQGCEVARFRDGALWATRHQVGVALWPARFRDGALWATRHQVGVAWWACKVPGMVLYDLPAIRSVWLLGLHGSGDRIKRAHCK